MHRKKLGTGGIEVSDICLGTMTWGEQNSAAEAHAQIAWALDHGIDFIDTAEMYPVPPGPRTQGDTERIVGEWLARNRARRGDIVLATKIAGPGRRDWVRDGATSISTRTVPWAIDDSLTRLQTDYIDLYQVHWPDRYVPMIGTWEYEPTRERDTVPILEQIEAFARAIDAGKIRAYGLSNETSYGVSEFVRLARAHGLPPPVSIQNCYNLVSRTFDGELAETCRMLDVPLLAFSPLAMATLCGKYQDGAAPPEGRLSRFPDFGERYRRPRVHAAVNEYLDVAARHGLAPTALAIAFVRGRWFTASTIIGATSIAQLDEQRAGFDLDLPADVLADIAAVHSRYPNPTVF